MQALYLDLDGTLLGANASLFHAGDGTLSLAGVQALQRCLEANVEVVLMSGRREAQVKEAARLFGQASYIFEAGAAVVLDGKTHWLTGDFLPGEKTIHQQIADLGAADFLLERFAGKLEYHDPWHLDREVSHLFRGSIDVRYAQALLDEAHGANCLRLLDNGIAHHQSPQLAVFDQVRVYHLVPGSAAKASAVAFHRLQRGYEMAQTFAVGDSREDLGVAQQVGSFWLVANAVKVDPELNTLVGSTINGRVTEAENGIGVLEAVTSVLDDSNAIR